MFIPRDPLLGLTDAGVVNFAPTAMGCCSGQVKDGVDEEEGEYTEE